MTKVIIEVKSLQNNDLIGKVVLSTAGRDENHYYVIVDKVDDEYYLLSNGSTKTIQMPKKKKIKHFNVLEDVDDEIKASIISKDKGTDLKVKKFLKLKGIVKEG
jgi:ribosomal protein L14E/L6E/L27E